MAKPVTRAYIRARVHRMRDRGMPIQVDSSFGQLKIESLNGRPLSPRTATGRLADWLEAYEEGWDAAKQALTVIHNSSMQNLRHMAAPK